MQLNSTLFTRPRRSPRLDQCLVDDAAHITLRQPREKGEHVTRVQLALLAIMRNARFGPEVARAEYGPNTAAAVLHFKRERNILNTALCQTAPDNIVGKKTIAALDQEMQRKQLPPGRQPSVKMGVAPLVKLGFAPEDLLRPMLDLDLKDVLGLGPDAVLPPLDIFVQFDGGDAAAEGTRRRAEEASFSAKFSTPAYLQTHLPAFGICFVGGRGDKNKAREAAEEVVKLRSIVKQGKTVIVGSSIGGLVALECAAILTGLVKLDYVAINDGAFFAPGEVNFAPFKIRVPTAPILAGKKDNFFQTFGHGLLRDARGPGGFMQGTEFHGPLDGFHNVDVAQNPGAALKVPMREGSQNALLPDITPGRLRLLKRNADQIHAAAAEQAEIEIEKEKARLFKP